MKHIGRCKKVISSCETLHQLFNARIWCRFYGRKYKLKHESRMMILEFWQSKRREVKLNEVKLNIYNRGDK